MFGHTYPLKPAYLIIICVKDTLKPANSSELLNVAIYLFTYILNIKNHIL